MRRANKKNNDEVAVKAANPAVGKRKQKEKAKQEQKDEETQRHKEVEE